MGCVVRLVAAGFLWMFVDAICKSFWHGWFDAHRGVYWAFSIGVWIGALVLAFNFEKLIVEGLARLMEATHGRGGSPGRAVKEDARWDVVLTALGDSRIDAMKAVRELTGLGLVEAREAVGALPRLIRKGVDREDAEAAARALQGVGCQVDIVGHERR